MTGRGVIEFVVSCVLVVSPVMWGDVCWVDGGFWAGLKIDAVGLEEYGSRDLGVLG